MGHGALVVCRIPGEDGALTSQRMSEHEPVVESLDSVLPSLTVCAEVVWITATGQGTAWGRS